MMMKITITLFLFLGSALWAEVFEFNTDIKSKYEFDSAQNTKHTQMANKLKMFQSKNASDEDIQIYLQARDVNESEPIDKEIMVEDSLRYLYKLHQASQEFFPENIDIEPEVEDNETVQTDSNKEVEL